MVTRMPELSGAFRVALLLLVVVLLVAGTCAGIVYCALQGSIAGVLLSALVPGLGAMKAVLHVRR
jgi:hypothetical protein